MMKRLFYLCVIVFLAISCAKNKLNDPYAKRIDSILIQMSLEEKIGQMTQMCFSTITLDGTKSLNLNVENFKEAITKYHVGSFLSGSDSVLRWYNFITAIQKLAVEETRLHIPLLIGIDHVHGANYVYEGTILPHNLNLSCSFNPVIVRECARVTAIETADLGLLWNFAPVLDVGKNSYWPRLYETFGEDPLVCARMGEAFITEYENCKDILPIKLSACAKHFIGYSDPKSGWDRTPSEIPGQVLYEIFVPPFKSAIDAGVKSVMVNSGEVNGEPVHASYKLLTGLLRNKLGFKGVILTDIKDIMKIVEMHAGAVDFKQATLLSVNAGIDMYMACNAYEFCDVMKQLVEEKKITVSRIDESVKRILRLKFELGLFDNPYPRKDRLSKIGSKEHFEIAKNAALESFVLLKNDSLLPLSGNKKILVTGFAAHSKKMLNGAWTFEWQGTEENKQPARMKTLYEALCDEFSSSSVMLYPAEGIETEQMKIDFMKVAKSTDVIIITAGEKPYSEFKGNITNLMLEEKQLALINAAILTGKPVVLVLIEGRPRIITSVADRVQAILFAGHPGQGGGPALAEVISGKAVPSGKLSFTYPADVAHHTNYYHKKSDKYNPLYEFGYGLSYTKFKYSDIAVDDTLIYDVKKPVKITVLLQNTGNFTANEVVLWYYSQEAGIITRPVKKLLSFEKILLTPGIRKKVELTLIPGMHFSYPDENGNMVLEKGNYCITVGNQKIKLVIL